MSVTRKKLFIANWKLNHNRKSAMDFFDHVLPVLGHSLVDVAVAPVAPMLDFLSQLLIGQAISLAAQNVFYADKGAFTGEWSAEHLAEINVKFCIVGHSERRTLFFETDEQVEKKAKSCLKANLVPVICVGESEAERDRNQTNDVIGRQVGKVLNNMELKSDQELVFAYEPIWAIGTKKTASAEQAQEINLVIRDIVADNLGKNVADRTRILYGGSVNADNIKEIVSMPDIDGALVGGASLHAASFLTMVKKLHDA
jgi:triosephosphate isomerase (TIM)